MSSDDEIDFSDDDVPAAMPEEYDAMLMLRNTGPAPLRLVPGKTPLKDFFKMATPEKSELTPVKKDKPCGVLFAPLPPETMAAVAGKRGPVKKELLSPDAQDTCT